MKHEKNYHLGRPTAPKLEWHWRHPPIQPVSCDPGRHIIISSWRFIIFIIIVISCEQGVGQKNNGPYTCRAENRQGRTKSNEIVLSIKCELIQLVSWGGQWGISVWLITILWLWWISTPLVHHRFHSISDRPQCSEESLSNQKIAIDRSSVVKNSRSLATCVCYTEFWHPS